MYYKKYKLASKYHNLLNNSNKSPLQNVSFLHKIILYVITTKQYDMAR